MHCNECHIIMTMYWMSDSMMKLSIVIAAWRNKYIFVLSSVKFKVSVEKLALNLVKSRCEQIVSEEV